MSQKQVDEKGRRRAADLAAGYTPLYARFNRLGVLGGTVLALLWGRELALVTPEGQGLTLVLVALAGILSADLLTGLIHWGCDTWGTVEVPLLGKTLIRTFREHHVDPQSITRHDWAEINGEACLGATLVFGGLFAFFPLDPEHIHFAWWLESFLVAAMFTNQLHKWSHMPNPPKVARWLQRAHLILTPEEHRRHHTQPHVHSYCITTGWMNPLLNTLGFWRVLERGIQGLTGALPREDDLGREKALEVHTLLFGDKR